MQYTDGDVILEEGSIGKRVYFIVSSKAEVSQKINEETRVMATLGKGDFFGEMAPLSGSPRSMTVMAIGTLYLYELSVDEMFQYMRDNPEIMRDVYTSLATRLRNTNLKVKELMRRAKSDNRDAHHMEVIDQLRNEIAEKDRQIQKLQRQIESLQS